MPVYEATSQLIIKAADERNVLTFEDVVKQDHAAYDYAETQYRLLRSRALARRTLTALDMWKRPPFGGPAPAAPATPAFSVRDSVMAPIRWATQALQPQPPSFEPPASNENRARVSRDRPASGRRHDRAHPEQPARRRQIPIARPATGGARGQRAGASVHRAGRRRTGSGVAGRVRMAHQAARRRNASSSKPASRRCSSIASNTTPSRSRTRRTSSCRSWPT